MHRILIVDDEKEIRLMLRNMLEKLGHEISTAPDGQKAIELFNQKPFDLLITDLVMPKKEGAREIFELKNQYPDIKIIAISGGSRIKPEIYLETAKAFGADIVMKKPFFKRQILDAVAKLLDNN
ncbi:MAG: response regulator [Candidatus Zixiibacteriota bacterium]